MATYIRQLQDNSGAKVLPATRAEAVYMSDNTTLDTIMSETSGVVNKAMGDKNGAQIDTTYVKSVTASGRTVTVTKGDGSSSTFDTQDTTYTEASTSKAGLMSASDKTKLDGIAANANNYTHPSHTAANEGLYKVTVDSLGHVTKTTAVAKGDITALGIPGQDTTYSTFKAASAQAAGGTGLVPAPAMGDQTKFLRADATWAVPTDTKYNVATQSANGLMSSTDKKKLDGIADGANNYTHPSYTQHASGLYKITVDASGHVSAATAVAKSDITDLGIPAQDTTYTNATQSAAGLMSAADKTKLDNIPTHSLGYVDGWGKTAEDLPELSA